LKGIAKKLQAIKFIENQIAMLPSKYKINNLCKNYHLQNQLKSNP
jgi:hypothetical protein